MEIDELTLFTTVLLDDETAHDETVGDVTIATDGGGTVYESHVASPREIQN